MSSCVGPLRRHCCAHRPPSALSQLHWRSPCPAQSCRGSSQIPEEGLRNFPIDEPHSSACGRLIRLTQLTEYCSRARHDTTTAENRYEIARHKGREHPAGLEVRPGGSWVRGEVPAAERRRSSGGRRAAQGRAKKHTARESITAPNFMCVSKPTSERVGS